MSNVAVVDLAYGDSGKGALVDRLAATGDFSVVVRFNGGCQAAHHVVQDDGRTHCFAQFGAGTFHRVPTFLSKYVMVEPLSLMVEGEALTRVGVDDPFSLLYVSPDCLVTTPYHWLLNRWREERRGDRAHGTCGRGVGATAEYALDHPDALRVIDLVDEALAVEKLADLRAWAEVESGQAMPAPETVFAGYEKFRQTVRISDDKVLQADAAVGRILFEGAQGVLLDEDWGFHPHTTWSRCTAVNADALAREYKLGPVDVVGVVRAYTTRHGAGPFVSETKNIDVPEVHNGSDGPQGAWRVGHFDGPAIQYAARAVAGSSNLVGVYVTHLDSAYNEPRLGRCVAYEDKVSGHERKLVPHFFTNFDARADQTDTLFRARPVLEPWRSEPSWDVADYLELPLYGMGFGPKTEDGEFTFGYVDAEAR